LHGPSSELLAGHKQDEAVVAERQREMIKNPTAADSSQALDLLLL
jgi:hypothetical protein